MDDYELDDRPCPKCGACPTHSRRCDEHGCDDGQIDLYEIDEDPMWHDPGDTAVCGECAGTGHQWWCPACGWDRARGTLVAPV